MPLHRKWDIFEPVGQGFSPIKTCFRASGPGKTYVVYAHERPVLEKKTDNASTKDIDIDMQACVKAG